MKSKLAFDEFVKKHNETASPYLKLAINDFIYYMQAITRKG